MLRLIQPNIVSKQGYNYQEHNFRNKFFGNGRYLFGVKISPHRSVGQERIRNEGAISGGI